MFVPTIKYKRVNEVQTIINSVDNLHITEKSSSSKTPVLQDSAKLEDKPKSVENAEKLEQKPKATEDSDGKKSKEEDKNLNTDAGHPNDAAEPLIEVDAIDKERIRITLTNGKVYTADRYCPHAGADLTYLGEVAEDEYPPEIGPVLMCTLHYWEFALEKGGRSGGGWATLNACPVESDQCPVSTNKALDW